MPAVVALCRPYAEARSEITRVKVTLGRVGGVLVLAFMRAWRLLPEPEMRMLTLAGEDIAGYVVVGFDLVAAGVRDLLHLHFGVCDVQSSTF